MNNRGYKRNYLQIKMFFSCLVDVSDEGFPVPIGDELAYSGLIELQKLAKTGHVRGDGGALCIEFTSVFFDKASVDAKRGVV